VIDPQRDLIHDRKRSKSLRQGAQFNGRQSFHSPCRAVGRPVIYRWII